MLLLHVKMGPLGSDITGIMERSCDVKSSGVVMDPLKRSVGGKKDSNFQSGKRFQLF